MYRYISVSTSKAKQKWEAFFSGKCFEKHDSITQLSCRPTLYLYSTTIQHKPWKVRGGPQTILPPPHTHTFSHTPSPPPPVQISLHLYADIFIGEHIHVYMYMHTLIQICYPRAGEADDYTVSVARQYQPHRSGKCHQRVVTSVSNTKTDKTMEEIYTNMLSPNESGS